MVHRKPQNKPRTKPTIEKKKAANEAFERKLDLVAESLEQAQAEFDRGGFTRNRKKRNAVRIKTNRRTKPIITENKAEVEAFERKLASERDEIKQKINNGELKPSLKLGKEPRKKKRPGNKATRSKKSQEKINAEVLASKTKKANRETVAIANPVKPINSGSVEPIIKKLDRPEDDSWYKKTDWDVT